eukprot:1381681-Pyramimonas_sp.AAC.1
MDVASVAHVFDGPGLLASLHASGSHLVADTRVIEEALDDIAARVEQRSLILSLAHHPEHVRRKGSLHQATSDTSPPPFSQVSSRYPSPGPPDVLLGEVGPDPVVELLEVRQVAFLGATFDCGTYKDTALPTDVAKCPITDDDPQGRRAIAIPTS